MALRADEDVISCDKLRGKSKYLLIRRFPNGETYCRRPAVTVRKSIAYSREPAELKHLSRRRKRKQQ